jgi:hypothetical protein
VIQFSFPFFEKSNNNYSYIPDVQINFKEKSVIRQYSSPGQIKLSYNLLTIEPVGIK